MPVSAQCLTTVHMLVLSLQNELPHQDAHFYQGACNKYYRLIKLDIEHMVLGIID